MTAAGRAFDWELDESRAGRLVGRHKRSMWKVAAFTSWTLAVYFWPHGAPTPVVCVAQPSATQSAYVSDGGPVTTIDPAVLDAWKSSPGFRRGDIR